MRSRVEPLGTPESRTAATVKGRAALDELVGLVGDLKIQLAAAETYAMVAPSRLGELEAQVGTLQQERDGWERSEKWARHVIDAANRQADHFEARAVAAEAEVAHLRDQNERLTEALTGHLARHGLCACEGCRLARAVLAGREDATEDADNEP